MYIFDCSNHDPIKNYTLHLVNTVLKVSYFTFFLFCNLFVDETVSFVP